MEKRLVLSFVLSFLVLYIWAMIAPKPPQPPTPSTTNAVTHNTQSDSDDLSTLDPEPASIAESGDMISGDLYYLENEKLQISFSSIGGSLVHIHLKEYDEPLPVDHIGGFQQFSNSVFTLASQDDNRLEFVLNSNGIQVQRSYDLSDNGYTLKVTDTITNLSEMSKNIRLDIIGFTLNMLDGPEGYHPDEPSTNGAEQNRDRGLNEYAVSISKGIKRKNNAWKFAPKEEKSIEGAVNWIAFRNRYYATIVKPEFATVGYSQKVLGEKVFQIHLAADAANLEASQSQSYDYTVFMGPEKTDLLKSYDSNFEEIKRYYKLGLFDMIAKVIGGFMKILYGFIPNWGVCIILVSIVIYYSMYPLTAKGMASMKRMQALQPKIQQLKERHEDNPQKLNQEMLELYRKEKINPLGGCLPMLLQMPVFIGLYQVLWRNVDFKGAHFLWIKDLSQPDRLITLDFSLPLIGSDINLLPILMMVIMALQQRFSAKNMTITDPMQLQQQKMMATVMPLVLGFIFYKFASGLTLYFTMFYIFSTLTQWKISKEPKVTTA